jgi:hypothetical protein
MQELFQKLRCLRERESKRQSSSLLKIFLSVSVFAVFFFLISPLLIPNFSTHAAAKVYYVAGDVGLDTYTSAEATNSATPWKTIQKAADTMVAGDTVNVKGGLSYTTVNTRVKNTQTCKSIIIPMNSGLDGSPITYQGWVGTGVPILDAQFVAGSSILTLRTVSYITINGFIMTNAIEGITVSQSTNIVIKNNIISNMSSAAFSEISSEQTYDLIANNTLVNNAYAIQYVGMAGSDSNKQIKNNIFANNTSAFWMIVLPQPILNDYNNLYGNGSNYTGILAGLHDTTDNPLFVSSSLSNYWLQRSSLLINRGVDLTGSGVTTDILGVPRPQGSDFDIGAYEYYDIPVTLTSAPASYITTHNATITGTASTISGATISSISYSIDDGPWSTTGVTGTSSFSITTSDFPDGVHTIRVRATDSYGNNSDSSLYGSSTFYVDTKTAAGPPISCTLTPPKLAPILTKAVSLGLGEVTLTFTDPNPTSDIDSYFIEYGTSPNLFQYATQSVGGKGTTTYTVKSLNPTKTYYFRVRSGNSCATGPWSNVVSEGTDKISSSKSQITNKSQTLNNENPKTKDLVISSPTPTSQPQIQTQSSFNIFTWIVNLFKRIFGK